MKQAIRILLCIIITGINQVSAQFSNEKIIQGIKADKVTSLFSCDLDGDNDVDVISASENDSLIAWYKNDGTGDFGTQQYIITNTATLVRVVLAADLDADNNMDVIAGYGNSVVWFENYGNGNFSQQKIITSNAQSVSSVYVSDLDNDTQQDILSSTADNKIAWYRNDGNGNFSLPIIITTQVSNPKSVIAADLDNDGLLDVVSASYNDNKVAWYRNTGNGNFGLQNVLSTEANGAMCVRAGDMNNDGYTDLVTMVGIDEKLLWFENTGSGFISHICDYGAWEGYSMELADISGDGMLDIVFGGSSLTVKENHGDGVFGNILIMYDLSENVSVSVGDINGDSNMDVISAAPDLYDISWFHYTGNYVFDHRYVLYTIKMPRDLFAADFNGDQYPDILAASGGDNKVSWYRNNGDGTFDHQLVLSQESQGAWSVHAADLDGDGDLDPLLASSKYFNSTLEYSNIAWFKNFGDGTFGSETSVFTTIPDGARSVYGDDIDGDGDYDVLAAFYDASKIIWYENNGNGIFNNQHIVSSNAFSPETAISVDLDGDTDPDVLASRYNKKISWYENGGFGIYNTPQDIYTDAWWPSIANPDFDNDGDKDVLIADAYDNKIIWCENYGFGNFSESNLITSNVMGVESIFACDMDLDGKTDVLSASKDDNKIAWYKNLGSGQFSNEIIVSTSAMEAMSVVAADIDNDGDQDIISASAGDYKIAWYENLLIVNAGQADPLIGTVLHQNYPNPFNRSTTIPFDIREKELVKLSICDVYGRTVALLLEKELSPGRYEVKFEGNNITPGIFLCRLDTKRSCSIKKIVIQCR